MTARRLTPDEAALWARVMAEVRPIASRAAPALDDRPGATPPSPSRSGSPAPAPLAGLAAARPDRRIAPAKAIWTIANTLDGTWDRNLSRGLVAPDATVDLHGHTLASAHALLDVALDRAIRRGDRMILLVTGKPPRATSERPHARGAIRAAVSDWLSGSRHAGSIVAVRGAHPRHGGAGALYLVLRRSRVREN